MSKELLKQAWKSLKNPSATDHVALCLGKAIFARGPNDKAEVFFGLLMQAFSPTTNQNKLANGWHKYKGLQNAIPYAYQLPTWLSDLFGEDDKELANQLLLKLAVYLAKADAANYVGRELTKEEDLLDNPTYVHFYTRQDLSPEQQLVQTAHAAALIARFDNFDPTQQHFLVHGVADREALMQRYDELTNAGVPCYGFDEPDIGYEMTSFATIPIRKSWGRKKKLFDQDTLLKLS